MEQSISTFPLPVPFWASVVLYIELRQGLIKEGIFPPA
jgi:hypothetical protein